jgi:hypothetical protein
VVFHVTVTKEISYFLNYIPYRKGIVTARWLEDYLRV